MAVHALLVLILFTMVSYSSGAYCVCNSGISDSVLQKNIDYACGAGADCSKISPNGACFNPNTVKDHCNIAVNSYFQKKGQTAESCSFSGTATVTSSPPSGGNSACFSAIASSSSTPTNPTIVPPGTRTGTGTGTGTGNNTSPSFSGLAPSGTTGMNDNSGSVIVHQTINGFVVLSLLVPVLVWPRLI